MSVGQRLHYSGDVSNQPQWFRILEIDASLGLGGVVKIEGEDDGEVEWLEPRQIGTLYQGHATLGSSPS